MRVTTNSRPTAGRTPLVGAKLKAANSSRRSASWCSTWPARPGWPAAPTDSELDEWERRAAPLYLNLRKASIYGGSNEVQRQIVSRGILGL